MRTLFVAVAILAGCNDIGSDSSVGDIGIVGGTDADECRATKSIDVLEFDASSRSETVDLGNPCRRAQDVSLDDPSGAFELTASPSADEVTFTIDVEFVAEEPGVYEGQAIIDSGFGSSVVELFGEIVEADE